MAEAPKPCAHLPHLCGVNGSLAALGHPTGLGVRHALKLPFLAQIGLLIVAP